MVRKDWPHLYLHISKRKIGLLWAALKVTSEQFLNIVFADLLAILRLNNNNNNNNNIFNPLNPEINPICYLLALLADGI